MDQSAIDYLLSLPLSQAILPLLAPLFGHWAAPILGMLLLMILALMILGALSAVGGFGTYAERKISADLQGRHGPNRVGPYGLLQVLADGIKMIGKEDIAPLSSDRFLFYLAPFLCIVGVVSTFAVLPFSSGLTLSHLNIGIFYLIAVSSLVGLGIFLAGYASNSKWSMLGGMRGASQIVSYEIPVTLSVLGVVIVTGGLSFREVLSMQGALPHQWLIFYNPFTFISFFVLFIAALAETNRAPFDLPEAESELVSGYHTEYTGMRFGLFALAEYMEVFVVCGVVAALFLGGYLVPFNLGGETLIGQMLQVGAFVTKTLLLYYVVIWIRWTFPRLRVDQLMTVCWKYLTPIALFCLIGNAWWVWQFDGHSLLEIISSISFSSGHGGH